MESSSQPIQSPSSSTPTIQSPIQKILFGSPGTGKSWRIKEKIIPKELGINESVNPENVIHAVFHPEYTYGDFMGKLVPLTRSKKVEYNYYEGHFLKALAQAYKNIVKVYDKKTLETSNPQNVALVIDEINRGNSSAIFGTIFQLLDRKEDGWSSYPINITDIEMEKLLELMGTEFSYDRDGKPEKYELKPFNSVLIETFQEKIDLLKIDIDVVNKIIRIPPNLSILATMNTSDNSIYFMDSAFKRRWDWEFVNWDDTQPPDAEYGALHDKEWRELIKNLNEFIKKKHTFIRGIEDKQIGYYFIKPPVPTDKIQNKLMFFLWDSVFNRDKEPLVELLEVKRDQLVTFGDFTKLHNEFIAKINAGEWRKKP